MKDAPISIVIASVGAGGSGGGIGVKLLMVWPKPGSKVFTGHAGA